MSSWYAGFLENVVIPNATLFSYLVVFGELADGLALVLGLFTGIAAFFAGFMHASFIFAGTAGANPLMAIVAVLLMLAWRVAGYRGLDRWVLPAIGVPGTPGTLFRGRRVLGYEEPAKAAFTGCCPGTGLYPGRLPGKIVSLKVEKMRR